MYTTDQLAESLRTLAAKLSAPLPQPEPDSVLEPGSMEAALAAFQAVILSGAETRARAKAQAEYAQHCFDTIELLRNSEEGFSLTLISANPEGAGPDNEAVEVCCSWTNWAVARYTGANLQACLDGAVSDAATGAVTRGRVVSAPPTLNAHGQKYDLRMVYLNAAPPRKPNMAAALDRAISKDSEV